MYKPQGVIQYAHMLPMRDYTTVYSTEKPIST